MKQRAPYRLEVFDAEDAEVYGTISAVDTLAGALLRFVGWNVAGDVVWDTEDPTTVHGTVTVTDATLKTYAATVAPLPAGVYTWEVQRTNTGQKAVLVWGYLTVTPSPPNND